jgi:hypothetical protein
MTVDRFGVLRATFPVYWLIEPLSTQEYSCAAAGIATAANSNTKKQRCIDNSPIPRGNHLASRNDKP